MQTKPSRLGQAARFCVGGAAGVITYYTTLYCLTEYLGVWYVVSAVIGFILNTGLNFILQKFWTFRDKNTKAIRRQVMLYIAMTVSFLIGNTAFLYLMVQYLYMWYIGAQMILTVVISTLSFIVSGKIFKAVPIADNQSWPPPSGGGLFSLPNTLELIKLAHNAFSNQRDIAGNSL